MPLSDLALKPKDLLENLVELFPYYEDSLLKMVESTLISYFLDKIKTGEKQGHLVIWP